MTPEIDPEQVAGIIREVAAEEIMPRFGKLAKADILHKGDRGDFATTADLESERVLTARLSALLPGSLVLGEEAAAKRPELFAATQGDKPVWIIDPVDGTHNFAQGIAHFCVIVALAQAGQVLAGWIYDPVALRMVMAQRGAGAWEAGARLAVAPPAPLDGMRGTIYAKATRPGVSPRIEEFKRRFANGPNNRCAGHEYLSLARGQSHFAMFSRLFPWDHAGGALIHQEAGGYNACWDGTPYRADRHEGGILLASDRPSWDQLADLLLIRS